MDRMTEARALRRCQQGLTLVELLVALAVGLIVAIAAVASLVVARVGFTSVDSSTELRENARFAATLIQRVVDESGFQDVAGGQFPTVSDQTQWPSVRGYDNAVLPFDPNNPSAAPAGFPAPGTIAAGSRPGSCGAVTDTSCLNGSDVLVVRYWGVSQPPGPGNPADGSVINCAGGKEPERATGPSYSVFSVALSVSGEPTLVCTYQDPSSGLWKTVALVTGVEAFQVLYGTWGVTAGNCSGPPVDLNSNLPIAQQMDTYLTAADMQGPTGDCPNNWARVRTLRIGLLLRGIPGTAVVAAATAASVPVLGMPLARYFAGDDQQDPGSKLGVPADGRLRTQMVFTVALRNLQQARP
ncbi:MAG: PilW family protein [Proteobacteria bacterium]|nr:PilW family protein [Pseudomonadota bacterium]